MVGNIKPTWLYTGLSKYKCKRFFSILATAGAMNRGQSIVHCVYCPSLVLLVNPWCVPPGNWKHYPLEYPTTSILFEPLAQMIILSCPWTLWHGFHRTSRLSSSAFFLNFRPWGRIVKRLDQNVWLILISYERAYATPRVHRLSPYFATMLCNWQLLPLGL